MFQINRVHKLSPIFLLRIARGTECWVYRQLNYSIFTVQGANLVEGRTPGGRERGGAHMRNEDVGRVAPQVGMRFSRARSTSPRGATAETRVKEVPLIDGKCIRQDSKLETLNLLESKTRIAPEATNKGKTKIA